MGKGQNDHRQSGSHVVPLTASIGRPGYQLPANRESKTNCRGGEFTEFLAGLSRGGLFHR